MGTIYKNPALVELIVELRWELSPTIMPANGGVDPFFDVVRADLAPRLATAGYPRTQDVVPPVVPRQLLAWQPIARFEAAPDRWPKAQLGPGVFSVHMAGTQYTGWDDFEPSVRTAFDLLLQSFPSYEKLLKLKQLTIRYVNVFSSAHGLETYPQFTSRYLGLTPVMPKPFLDAIGVEAAHVSTTSQSRLPIKIPVNAHLNISAAEGTVNNIQGCVLQLAVEGGSGIKVGHTELMDWFNGAHDVATRAFPSLVTSELIQIMKPEERP